jgi:S-(hydroxymethyl)glutathione dehydrogenase/alcohol dehydrogenase
MHVQAAVCHSPNQPISVETLELLPPSTGEVLVQMKAVGVCHSDWHVVTGDSKHVLPVVLGHEGAGVVEAVGPGVAHLRPGDRVCLSWAPSCGRCFYCLEDRPSLCETFVEAIWAGTMQDGTTRYRRDGEPVYHYSALACFSEKVVVAESSCIKLEADLPWSVAAVLGCAVTTGVGAALNTAKVKPGSSVVVLGAGGVGLSAVMGAVVAGASTIIAIDPLESRRQAALDLGATDALPTTDPQPVVNLTEGRGADYVIEAVGRPDVQEATLALARNGGMVVLSGIAPMGTATNFPGAILTRQEKTVAGSFYGTCNPLRDFPLYARMYEAGQLPLDKLVSHTYPLSKINEAYDDMLKGRSVRGVILFD